MVFGLNFSMHTTGTEILKDINHQILMKFQQKLLWSKIHKFTDSVRNKEHLPQQCENSQPRNQTNN